MFDFVNYYSLSLFMGGVVALLSGAAVFLNKDREQVGLSWMLLNISTAIWSFGYFSMIISDDLMQARISNWVLHYGAILIPVLYFYFIANVTKTTAKYKNLAFVLGAVALFFFAVNTTPLFMHDVTPKYIFSYAPDAGPLYIYFTIYFFVITIYAQYILLKYILSLPRREAIRFWFVFYSAIAGFIGGGSVFFLTFNVNIPPYGLAFFAFYPVIITFAILKYGLFNIKIISAELLIGVLWILLLFRTILATERNEQLLNAAVFALTILFGISVIRSVYKEVEQREKIEKMAMDLEFANAKFAELDQLKSEFVSLASHQLRGPLTAIKGYASEIIEGDFGKVPKYLIEPINTIFRSCQSLVIIVEDFLNVSRIEQGRMRYDYTEFSIGELVEEVMQENKPNFERKGLNTYVVVDKGPKVKADRGKIKQIIGNLVDNAIKYTPKGEVTCGVTRNGSKVVFSIKDTGVGIAKGTMPKLFQKFYRAEDASKANILGTGLGLYVASQMIKAHGGRIWAESEGENKGSAFFVELEAIG